jgi:hypothetical protein
MANEIVLTVILSPSKGVAVQGPIQDKLFCLGMLELAKKAVLDYVPSSIIKPDLQIVPKGN